MFKLEVSTHSGSNDIVEVEHYDANEMAEQLNDNTIQAVAIGNNVYSRIDLKNIKPTTESSEEPNEAG